MSDRQLDIVLVGYGRMGRAIESAALARGHRVVGRIDADADGAAATISAEAVAGAAVALEFTVPESAPGAVRALLELDIPVVSGTTGWQDQLEPARRLATERQVGFLWAPNFSLGMQLVFRLAAQAARALGAAGGYDPWLFEEHHAGKADAPSGTARRLADTLVQETPGRSRWGVAPEREKISGELVPVAWVRAGGIPGTHRVGWDGAGETIEIVHRVRDRGVFAAGAVRAAEWLVGQRGPAALEDMVADLMGLPAEPRK
jgi:4-hydroxy-tetrahydrodipicolinate reductase